MERNYDREALVLSMCGPIYNRIKTHFEYPCKNMNLANNKDVKNYINLIGEQLLPQWCKKNMANGEEIS